MGRITLLAHLLLGVHLATSLTIDIPTPLEARDASSENREADPKDEVVYLADCRKYKNKESDEKDIDEHASFTLYHDTYDFTRDQKFSWKGVATPSYPKSQRIDSMGGAFVDWTLGKQDDRIESNFEELQRRFWVHSLTREGDPKTKVTGIASLGDHAMRCYQDTYNLRFTKGGWYYRCIADYSCTRTQRQIRRTQISVSEKTVDVEILALKPRKAGNRDPRVEGIISNVYYWLSTIDAKKGSTADEIVIDNDMKRQTGKKYHAVRINWKAGASLGDPTYDPNLVKLISKELVKTVEPEVVKNTKLKTAAYWDMDYHIYKAPFPAQIEIQYQIATQEQQDWKATDFITVDIVSYGQDTCGENAALASLLKGIFSAAAAVTSGGASAVLGGLGAIIGATSPGACVQS